MPTKTYLLMRTATKNSWLFFYRLSILCAILVLGSVGALAQEPATSLDQLKLILEKGEKVTMIDRSGTSTTGKIERIAPDAVEMKVSGKVLTFEGKEIRQITRRKNDSVLNGFLIGAGVGFGATFPLYWSVADNHEKGLAVAASALWGLIGGGIGAIVDACVTEKQMVYFHPKSNVSWSVHPFYSNSASPSTGVGTFLPYAQQYTGVDRSKGLALTIRF